MYLFMVLTYRLVRMGNIETFGKMVCFRLVTASLLSIMQ